MKKLTVLAFLLLNLSLFAQDASVKYPNQNMDSVKVHAAMMDYLEAFYEGDTAKIIRSISPSVSKYGYWKDEKTKEYNNGSAMSYREMFSWIARNSKKINAKFSSIEKVEIFEIQDKTACGKVTAWWGTDYILLEKFVDKWFIRMILWQSPSPKN
jgi:Putative lumazine-binding